jgi:large subunit ribosomal protein L15
MPLFRRLPKRGFNNFNFRTDYQVVNLLDLDKRFDDGATVDLDALKAARLVNGRQPLVKVLNKGQLTKKLTVHAHAFSSKAKAAIEQAGGAANLIERVKPAEAWAAKRRTVASNQIGKQSASKASSETASSETPPAEDATE